MRVAKLVDAGSYEAAETLLDSLLPKTPDDAGMYVQYARAAVMTRDFYAVGSPGLSIPNLAAWTEAEAAVIGLTKRAIQFDPECAEWASDCVIRSMFARVRIADEGSGFGALFNGTIDHSFKNRVGVLAFLGSVAELSPSDKRQQLIDAIGNEKRYAIDHGHLRAVVLLAYMEAEHRSLSPKQRFVAVNTSLLAAIGNAKEQMVVEGGLPRQKVPVGRMIAGLYSDAFAGLGTADDPQFTELVKRLDMGAGLEPDGTIR